MSVGIRIGCNGESCHHPLLKNALQSFLIFNYLNYFIHPKNRGEMQDSNLSSPALVSRGDASSGRGEIVVSMQPYRVE